MGIPAGLPRKPAPTRWSLVRRAGERPTPESREALAELCRLYWYPLYAFARRDRVSAENATDLTQGFFARLIEKNDLSAADPARGHFRSWLLGAFKHYLANERDRATSQKAGGGALHVALDAQDAEGRYLKEPSHDLTPEKLFERRWTLELQARVLGQLRSEYERDKKLEVFEALKGSLIWADADPHAEVAAALKMTPVAVRQAARRLRQRFGDLFHSEVADTVEDPDEVEAEVRRLLEQL